MGERSGDRIPYRDTEEDAEVGSVGKRWEVQKKPKTEIEGIVQGIKSDLGRGRKGKWREKRLYDGDCPSGLLLGQPPSLPPVPSQVRC